MGDNYEWTEPCPKCGAELQCYYANLFRYVKCDKCNTTFDIIMEFTLMERKNDRKTK